MKTKQRLITCFNTGLLLLVAVAARANIPPLLPPPAPQQVILQLSATEQWLASFNRAKQAELTHTPTDEIQTLLRQARESGDQRLLGQALLLLNQTPSATLEIKLLRAATLQALHRFDAALEELQAVLQQDPINVQAWLMRASLLNVRGDYTAAQTACRQLIANVSPLLSGSCSSSVLARQGQPERAYALLEQLYKQAAAAQNDAEILHYAHVSLAEIADQLGEASAAHWWSLALASQPRDLYTRIGAARNAYYRNAFDEVIRLTENATEIDALLLLRTLALQQVKNPQAQELKQRLVQRLEQARARGDTLHGRDHAAILLDLLQRPTEALALAQQNWQQQREPEDTALLLRAALAAKRPDIYLETHRWLQQSNQTHVRYPTQIAETSKTHEAHP